MDNIRLARQALIKATAGEDQITYLVKAVAHLAEAMEEKESNSLQAACGYITEMRNDALQITRNPNLAPDLREYARRNEIRCSAALALLLS